MCGRYAITTEVETLFGVFDARPDPDAPYGGDSPRPRYNIAPTTMNPVLRVRDLPDAERPARTLAELRWGLVPSWAKDPSIGNRKINARAETASSSNAFAPALHRRRALVPVSGFYEWQALGTGRGAPKQPYWITPANGEVMALDGLWEYWKRGDQAIASYTVLTTEAVGPMARVHHRMPLILPQVDWERWLDRETSGADVTELLQPPPVPLVELLEFRPVGDAVGNVRNDEPGLLDPVTPRTTDDPTGGAEEDGGQLSLL